MDGHDWCADGAQCLDGVDRWFEKGRLEEAVQFRL